jgi:isoleucyl-tRNA synthetase
VEGNGVLVKKVKCNFRTMGKKFGKLMKGIAAYMNTISQEEIGILETTGSLALTIDGQEVVVDKEDVEIFSDDIPGWLVANDGNLTVALEIELTDELRNEGMARELINRIQKLRKESGLEITDRIVVTVAPNPQTDAAINNFGDFIKAQVLADDIIIAENDGVNTEFDEFSLNLKIEKVEA